MTPEKSHVGKINGPVTPRHRGARFPLGLLRGNSVTRDEARRVSHLVETLEEVETGLAKLNAPGVAKEVGLLVHSGRLEIALAVPREESVRALEGLRDRIRAELDAMGVKP